MNDALYFLRHDLLAVYARSHCVVGGFGSGSAGCQEKRAQQHRCRQPETLLSSVHFRFYSLRLTQTHHFVSAERPWGNSVALIRGTSPTVREGSKYAT